MTKKAVKMWVDPEFKKVIKTNASKNDITIIDYTRQIAMKENGEGKNVRKETKLKFWF